VEIFFHFPVVVVSSAVVAAKDFIAAPDDCLSAYRTSLFLLKSFIALLHDYFYQFCQCNTLNIWQNAN